MIKAPPPPPSRQTERHIPRPAHNPEARWLAWAFLGIVIFLGGVCGWIVRTLVEVTP